MSVPNSDLRFVQRPACRLSMLIQYKYSHQVLQYSTRNEARFTVGQYKYLYSNYRVLQYD